MKFIKNFESFHQTGIDDSGSEVVPKYNPVIKQKSIDFVDSELNSDNYMSVLDISGMSAEKDITGEELDKLFDVARERAIKYYTENPEEIGQEFDVKKFVYTSGNGMDKRRGIND